jgi:hypothetical protein
MRMQHGEKAPAARKAVSTCKTRKFIGRLCQYCCNVSVVKGLGCLSEATTEELSRVECNNQKYFAMTGIII